MRIAALAAAWLGSCAAGRPSGNRPPPPAAARQPGPPSAGMNAQELPPLSSEATFHYLRAQLMLDSGNAAGAVEAAREALVFDPGSAVLHTLLARALLEAGRAGEALAEADRALALAPSAPDALRARVDVLWRLGRRNDAEPLLKKLQQLHPQDLQLASQLETLELARNDLAAATRTQQALVAARPGDAEAALVLAQACVARGRWDCAAAEADAAARRLPQDLAVCTGRAQVLDRAARFGDAATAWRACVALAPDASELRAAAWVSWARAGNSRAVLQDATQATGHNAALAATLAHALLAEGQPQLARQVLAPHLGSKHVGVVTVDALAAAALGQCAAAMPALAAVPEHHVWRDAAVTAQLECAWRAGVAAPPALLAAQPASLPLDGVAAWCRLHARAGQPQRAQAAATQPGLDTATRAQCLAAAGQDAAARDLLQATLGAQPEDPAVLRAVTHAHAVLALWPQALQTARAWLAVAPEDPFAQNVTAYLLVRNQQDAREAVRLATAALALRPDRAELADTLGMALLAQGDTAGALTTLEGAAARLPADAEVLLHLGDARAAAGQNDRARQAWKAARALLPAEPHVQAALAQRPATP